MYTRTGSKTAVVLVTNSHTTLQSIAQTQQMLIITYLTGLRLITNIIHTACMVLCRMTRCSTLKIKWRAINYNFILNKLLRYPQTTRLVPYPCVHYWSIGPHEHIANILVIKLPKVAAIAHPNKALLAGVPVYGNPNSPEVIINAIAINKSVTDTAHNTIVHFLSVRAQGSIHLSKSMSRHVSMHALQPLSQLIDLRCTVSDTGSSFSTKLMITFFKSLGRSSNTLPVSVLLRGPLIVATDSTNILITKMILTCKSIYNRKDY